jgi:hypothetical protein
LETKKREEEREGGEGRRMKLAFYFLRVCTFIKKITKKKSMIYGNKSSSFWRSEA